MWVDVYLFVYVCIEGELYFGLVWREAREEAGQGEARERRRAERVRGWVTVI